MTTASIDLVALKHYRSIRACRIRLGALTVLVGPNGSGKSNVLDAVRLVSDALTTSLDQALRERGGVNEVRRRSTGHPHHIGVRIDLRWPAATAFYAFEIGARTRGGFAVVREVCQVQNLRFDTPLSTFVVTDGSIVSSEPSLPLPGPDRLYLTTAAALPAFRPVYDALSRMGFYNLSPDAIRDLQTPDTGELLARDGRNMASVLHRLAEVAPDSKKLIEDYLAAVVPGVTGVDRVALGPKETLEFRQAVEGSRSPWRFPAQSMSDGTLRALGVLVAAFQQPSASIDPTLVGIEEPEVVVHPAAAGVLREALRTASEDRQILLTSHSPELLDDSTLPPESILAVRATSGTTDIGPLDAAGRNALRAELFTAGELLRVDQLIPEPTSLLRGPEQLDLFTGGPA